MPATVLRYKGFVADRIGGAHSGHKAEAGMKAALLDKVIQANDIQVPQERIDDEVQQLYLQMHHQRKYQALLTRDYDSLTRDDTAEWMDALRDQAVRQLKADIVIRCIIEMENLTVTGEELEQEAEAIAARQHMPIEMVKGFLGEDPAALEHDLLVEKAIDFIYASAVILSPLNEPADPPSQHSCVSKIREAILQ